MRGRRWQRREQRREFVDAKYDAAAPVLTIRAGVRLTYER